MNSTIEEIDSDNVLECPLHFHYAHVLTMLQDQRWNRSFCDLILDVRGVPIYAHSCIVAAFCPTVSDMLLSGQKSEKAKQEKTDDDSTTISENREKTIERNIGISLDSGVYTGDGLNHTTVSTTCAKSSRVEPRIICVTFGYEVMESIVSALYTGTLKTRHVFIPGLLKAAQWLGAEVVLDAFKQQVSAENGLDCYVSNKSLDCHVNLSDVEVKEYPQTICKDNMQNSYYIAGTNLNQNVNVDSFSQPDEIEISNFVEIYYHTKNNVTANNDIDGTDSSQNVKVDSFGQPDETLHIVEIHNQTKDNLTANNSCTSTSSPQLENNNYRPDVPIKRIRGRPRKNILATGQNKEYNANKSAPRSKRCERNDLNFNNSANLHDVKSLRIKLYDCMKDPRDKVTGDVNFTSPIESNGTRVGEENPTIGRLNRAQTLSSESGLGGTRNEINTNEDETAPFHLELERAKNDVELYESAKCGSRYRCNKCFKKFNTIDDLKAHMIDHPIYKCEQCGMTFQRKYSFTRHMGDVHQGRPYLTCMLCTRDKSNYKSPDIDIFKAKNESQLRRHAQEIHQVDRPFVCSVDGCVYAARSYERLRRHVFIHGTNKTFECDKCARKFSQEDGLVSHKKSCYQIRAYLCDLCGKSFNQLSAMKLHRKAVHFGDRSLSCSVCSKTFSDGRNLKRHMLIHENIFPYKCPSCDQQFRHTPSLKIHIKTNHEANSAKRSQSRTVQSKKKSKKYDRIKSFTSESCHDSGPSLSMISFTADMAKGDDSNGLHPHLAIAENDKILLNISSIC